MKPGGMLFVVVTDETVGYTGLALKSFIEGCRAIGDVLWAAGTPVEVNVLRKPSRLYGHNFADVIALSSIALLASVEKFERFEAAAALLRHKPKAVDLRIEDDGLRKGMWSVAQPQWIAAFRRTS